MEKQPAPTPDLTITREEMIYLLQARKARTLIGTNPAEIANELESYLQTGNQENIVQSLASKKIIKRKGSHEFEVHQHFQNTLDTLFFPEHALFVLRNRSKTGRQVFYVLQKGKSIILHSYPKEREHFLHVFSRPEDLFLFLMEWIPLVRLAVSPVYFDIETEDLCRIQAFAEKDDSEDSLNLLEKAAIDSIEKKNLVHAIGKKKISGGIALVSYHEGKAQTGDSITFVSDGWTSWLISKSKSSTPEGKPLSVRRTGPDFLVVVRDFVEQLTGEILPRHQADSSGKFIRYTLSLDEFTMALAAVNCVELSTKLYAAISRDIKREQYADRMNRAQKSLVEHRLCTISERGLPILNEDLAQAVYAVAKADSMIQILASGAGPVTETGVYLVHDRFFSAYYNYGEQLQVLEYGKYKDAGLYLELLFPLFCKENEIQKISSDISIDAVNKVKIAKNNQQENEKILIADGMSNQSARLLAEDFSDTKFRATLFRKDPPDDKQINEEKKNGKKPNLLLLMKSPRRSWMFQFTEHVSQGRTTIPVKADLTKALRELVS